MTVKICEGLQLKINLKTRETVTLDNLTFTKSILSKNLLSLFKNNPKIPPVWCGY